MGDSSCSVYGCLHCGSCVRDCLLLSAEMVSCGLVSPLETQGPGVCLPQGVSLILGGWLGCALCRIAASLVPWLSCVCLALLLESLVHFLT